MLISFCDSVTGMKPERVNTTGGQCLVRPSELTSGVGVGIGWKGT